MFPLCLFAENSKRESKENQWMGVSVSSQGPGGKVLVSVLEDDKLLQSHGQVPHSFKYFPNMQNKQLFCLLRRAPIATSAAAMSTRRSNPVTSLAAATCWVRTWPSTQDRARTEATGTSVRVDPEATRCLEAASRGCPPPLTRTSITSSSELLGRTTGKVVDWCLLSKVYQYVFKVHRAKSIFGLLLWYIGQFYNYWST